MVEGLLAENGQQLNRLLDLYISGDFPRATLDERKAKLTQTIEGLRQERDGLVARLQDRTLTGEQLADLQAFAAQVAEGLAERDDDFDFRRFVIDTLDVTATLVVEDGEKVVYGRCVLGDEALSISSQTTPATSCSTG